MKRSVKFKVLSVAILMTVIATVMMWFPAIYNAQGVSYTYQAVNRNLAANGSYCAQGLSCNIIGSGAKFHQLTWNVTGTVSACTVTVDTSADNVTWSSGGAITSKTCTSNGTALSTSTIVNYVRMTISSFTGTGAITLNLTGFLNNPTGGGGSGTLTEVDTTLPIVGGPITTTGTLTCPTCVVAPVNPSAGVAHFAGSTQTVTSSPVVNADVTSIDGSTKITGVIPGANLPTQVMTGGYSSALPTLTQQFSITYRSTLNLAVNVSSVVSRAMTVTGIQVNTMVAEGAAATLSFTLVKCNTTACAAVTTTAVTCTVGNSSSTCSASGFSVALAAGDLISMQTVQTGTGSTSVGAAAITFQ